MIHITIVIIITIIITVIQLIIMQVQEAIGLARAWR